LNDAVLFFAVKIRGGSHLVNHSFKINLAVEGVVSEVYKMSNNKLLRMPDVQRRKLKGGIKKGN